MKKNILAILILAATLINLTLTAVSLFITLPTARRTNNLITKVVQVIDLELESPTADGQNISIEDIGTFKIEGDMTINLSPSANDSKAHYAVVTCSLSLNKKAEDFSKKEPLLAEQVDYIKEVITSEIGSYSLETVLSNKETIKATIKEKLNERFDSNFIIGISFSDFIVK